MTLPDIQSTQDDRYIDKVGIREVRMPFYVYDSLQTKRLIPTVATFSVYCDLQASRGVHMSRFAEILNRVAFEQQAVSSEMLMAVAHEVRIKLEAQTSYVKARFPFFRVKKAPASGLPGYMDYDCELSVVEGSEGVKLTQTVEVGYTSLCPCSKEISLSSAHNQRSIGLVRMSLDGLAQAPIDFSDIIERVEEAASCDLYSVLKRPDEKFVTERAYSNPRFVEDMTRQLRDLFAPLIPKHILGLLVVVTHQESIHKHDAVAVIRAGEWLE